MTEALADAARLIEWGLKPRERPASHEEYARLVSRFEQDADFATLARDVAQGLNLKILGVSSMGVVLTPLEGSAFAYRASEFKNVHNVDTRMLDGLVQVAIATTIFPRAVDLEEDPAAVRPPTNAKEVDATLRSLAAKHRETSQDRPDPTIDTESQGLVEAWRVYERRNPTRETPDGRAAAKDSLRLIGTHLERLTELGCFVRHGEGDQAQFTATWRYQILVKEFAATKLHGDLQRLLGGQ